MRADLRRLSPFALQSNFRLLSSAASLLLVSDAEKETKQGANAIERGLGIDKPQSGKNRTAASIFCKTKRLILFTTFKLYLTAKKDALLKLCLKKNSRDVR